MSSRRRRGAGTPHGVATRLLICQPYLPAYRVEFFESLVSLLEDDNIHVTVCGDEVSSSQMARGDSRAADWFLPVKRLTLNAFGARFTVPRRLRHWRNFDAIVVGLEGSNFESHIALIMKRRYAGVAVWGHVQNYATRARRIDQFVERLQMASADHVFAYTKSGVKAAQSRGVAKSKITSIENSIETSRLISSMRALQDLTSQTREHLGLRNDSTVFAFIGGLDRGKRIDFLAEIMEITNNSGRDVQFVVAGFGDQDHLLDSMVESGVAVRVGYADIREKARVLSVADAIVMPGRVGLVAVDALASGRPIITTEDQLHGPEVEYLQEGTSLITLADDAQLFAERLCRPVEHELAGAWNCPTLEGMVLNFRAGILDLLGQASS